MLLNDLFAEEHNIMNSILDYFDEEKAIYMWKIAEIRDLFRWTVCMTSIPYIIDWEMMAE